MTLIRRLMPVAIAFAVLATLLAFGASGLSLYRLWETGRGQLLNDPYYFSEELKRFVIMVIIAVLHFAAVAICLLALRNRYARTAAYFFLAGLVAGAVLRLASVWPVIMLSEMPKRYVDYVAVDVESAGWLVIIAKGATALLLLAGWARLIVAVVHRMITPAALRSGS